MSLPKIFWACALKILALIPARGGSKRLPGKNIRQLGDRPLIAWSIDVACMSVNDPFVMQAWGESQRTGETHGLGGFAGVAKYEGNLTEFLPWLQAAQWTGVGRLTPWGNGYIQVR